MQLLFMVLLIFFPAVKSLFLITRIFLEVFMIFHGPVRSLRGPFHTMNVFILASIALLITLSIAAVIPEDIYHMVISHALASIGCVKLVCKKWKTLSKDAFKDAKREHLVSMAEQMVKDVDSIGGAYELIKGKKLDQYKSFGCTLGQMNFVAKEMLKAAYRAKGLAEIDKAVFDIVSAGEAFKPIHLDAAAVILALGAKDTKADLYYRCLVHPRLNSSFDVREILKILNERHKILQKEVQQDMSDGMWKKARECFVKEFQKKEWTPERILNEFIVNYRT